MNKQIEHCLYQSGLTASGCWDELGAYEQEGIEKFAKFIVRECAEMVRIQNEQFMENESHYGVVSTDILKHFGLDIDS